ncbi:MAG: LamG domain-containing protein [Phycisphaerae bacterium]|nr:LamG domain-containing protein [Phycisphaerae bacterium]
MKRTIVLTMLVAVVALSASVAQADTVGYWRFEDTPVGGVFQDSSTYNNDVTAGGNPAHYTLQATGRGANFDDPIPQTSVANAKAADLDGTNDFYSCADQTEFAVDDFTIEAYVRKDSGALSQTIAGQFHTAGGSPSNERSWLLQVRSDSYAGSQNDVLLWLGETGSTGICYSTGVDILAGIDYFVAVSFDESDQTSGIKVYVKTLSGVNAGTWDTATLGHTITSLHDSTGTFNIGAYNTIPSPLAAAAVWDGLIDEVRFSDTVLSQNDMLAMPEPATMTLLLLGLPLALRRRRK